MKKLIVRISFILIAVSTLQLSAQWQNDVRLSNNPSSSLASRDRGIAVYGNNLHVVWQDQRDGEVEVYYTRSTNNGVSWGAEQRLSPVGDYSGAPTIALYQSTIHIVWMDQRLAGLDIFYLRSTDNGTTWQPEVQLTTDLMDSQLPSLSVSGNNVYLAWDDNRHPPNKEIYFRRSTNAGLNWSSEMRLTNDTMLSNDVSIASTGQNLHLAWVSGTGNSEIYYRRSTNGGVYWLTEQRLTNDPAISFYPCVAVSGQNINLFWSDSRDGNYEIYFKRSTDGGIAWSADSRLTNAAGNSLIPGAVVFGQMIGLVWSDLRTNFYKVFYKASTNGGLNWSTDLMISPPENFGYANNSSIDISDSSLHVVWEDARHGSPEIYYRKNILGTPVAVTPVNGEIPSSYSLSQNYPNPFNPVTNIKFSIPKAGLVKLTVFDVLGREVSVLVNEVKTAGSFIADLDASMFSSGVYFYRLESNNFVETKKMLLVR
ncbi:MAG: T9SS type A sorting domain-containing protein [Ignavibacteria bacterium]|nr:T9SS type A sorting domain-containing protein [Ignavibacteria bacterium]